jgi:hypothetical protein
MFFNEIAEQVAPIIDQVFVEEGVRIIGEDPGATLLLHVPHLLLGY